MFILKQAITPFLLPPGIFIIFLIFSGFFFLGKRNLKAGIASLLVGCSAWAISISPVSDAMIRGLESKYPIPRNIKGDVIIVLGTGVYNNAPDLSGIGAPSDGYLARIVTAVRLQKKLEIPIIASGAAPLETKGAQGHVVKRFLMDLGVPAEKIIIEDKSKDTYQNAEFTRLICVKKGYDNPILITSAYHLKRAVFSFDSLGLKVLPVPCDFFSYHGNTYEWNAYLPGNFMIASIAIKEYLGLLIYKLTSHKFDN